MKRAFLGLTLVLSLLVLLTGCGSPGSIHFEGTVYELIPDSPQTFGGMYITASEIASELGNQGILNIEDRVSSLGRPVPLPGAVVSVWREAEYEKNGDQGDRFVATSDESGKFEYSTATAPGVREQLVFKVTKPGYGEAQGGSGGSQSNSYIITAVLVKE